MGFSKTSPVVLQLELQVIIMPWAVIDLNYEMELLRAAKGSLGLDCLEEPLSGAHFAPLTLKILLFAEEKEHKGCRGGFDSSL